MQKNQHEYYRNHLEDFVAYLREDWKRWVVMQIKQTMLEGKTSMILCKMTSADWQKGKTILNFWKQHAIPQKDKNYYHPKTNVLITNKWIRKIIDFLIDIGMDWVPVAPQKYETISLDYNEIHAIIKYPRLTS